MSASEDMKHACGIKLWNGMELLIHIGIDTVQMNGKGFELLVKEGDKIKTGTPLIRFDAAVIKEGGGPVTTMLIIIDAGEAKNLTLQTNLTVVKGETVVSLYHRKVLRSSL